MIGDSSVDANVAPVQATDPSSNTQGVVVRDVNTSAIVSKLNSGITVSGTLTGITNSIGVYFDRGNPAVTVYGSQANTPLQTNSSGAIKVYDISTGTIATVSTVTALTGITNSIAIHHLSTGGTLRVSMQDEPTVVASGKDGTTTRAVKMDSGGAIKIYDIVTGTLNAVTTVNTVAAVTNITNSIAIHHLSTGGTLRVSMQDEPTVVASGKDGSTTRAIKMDSAGAIKVYDIVTGTINTVNTVAALTNITNSIAIHHLSTGGTLRVSMQDEPTVVASGKDGTTTRAIKMDSAGAIKVYDIVTGTIATVTTLTGITNSIAIYVGATAGTIAIQLKPGTLAVSLDPGYTLGKVNAGTGTFSVSLDPGYTLGKVDQGNATTSGTQAWLSNLQSTANIFTVSGSTSGISVSGVTLISPSANASFKVFGYSIQTTGQASLMVRFTNGAGTSPTEFWRPLVTASGVTGAQGANMMSRPAAPLFVTGVSTTLSLLLDTATLTHYSVSYTKESA